MSDKKRIGIMTTGGDCSGLNTVIQRLVSAADSRGWSVIGIRGGTDGLYSTPTDAVELTPENMPLEFARLSGSILRNGRDGTMNFEEASRQGILKEFNAKLNSALKELNLDTLVLVGGNGSLSLAWGFKEIYSGVKLVCVPKTIDMDVPLTDATIGFNTAVQQLTNFCDQLLLTARSHRRWFVIQAMGRDCGKLALEAGVASGASAILIPEIKFDINSLIEHIKNAPTDYGVIVVSEGVSLRGHSGKAAEMIARQLSAAGIYCRAEYPEHFQRAGDTTATDRIVAASMADCAVRAIENNETYVMTAMQNGKCKTIALAEFFSHGDLVPDPHIPGIETSNAYVEPDDPLLGVATGLGAYVGEIK